ncbi:nucleotidyltransferase domain-containing protein [Actinophytocola sp.]|uniref:nucleotidyltransferase domain-containing protein n=1 Tax=Actinophytocola sp. TaxID=1872138 RepID=UPI002D614AE1|nr:nucleotidyltransferase domain-containing protein [Actinophytocola sp.]HYQ69891.1 nucleotidyltransferase domain-containing protein [Actinophytocola sp.]
MSPESMSDRALDHMVSAARRLVKAPRAVVIYGSHAVGTAGPRSDVDVLVVGEGGADSVDGLAEALVEFSTRNGIALDAEVPYANKILCGWEELELAATCHVFAGGAHARRVFTPVDRRPEFLASPLMRQRLFLNVLTQPTVSWTEDRPRLRAIQANARTNLVGTAEETLMATGGTVTLDSMVAIMIGADGVSGKDYLGYLPDQHTRRHLGAMVRTVRDLSAVPGSDRAYDSQGVFHE